MPVGFRPKVSSRRGECEAPRVPIAALPDVAEAGSRSRGARRSPTTHSPVRALPLAGFASRGAGAVRLFSAGSWSRPAITQQPLLAASPENMGRSCPIGNISLAVFEGGIPTLFTLKPVPGRGTKPPWKRSGSTRQSISRPPSAAVWAPAHQTVLTGAPAMRSSASHKRAMSSRKSASPNRRS